MAGKASYDTNEAEEILKKAASRRSHDRVSHDRLMAMAAELDITPEELESALAEREAEQAAQATEQEKAQLRDTFIAERHATFWPHFIPFLMVHLLLIFINAMTGGIPWFLFSFLGWGIGLATHAYAVLPTRGRQFEADFTKWREQRVKRAEAQLKREEAKAKRAERRSTKQPAQGKSEAELSAIEELNELERAATEPISVSETMITAPGETKNTRKITSR